MNIRVVILYGFTGIHLYYVFSSNPGTVEKFGIQPNLSLIASFDLDIFHKKQVMHHGNLKYYFMIKLHDTIKT